jgi:hypothetical protein
MASRLKRVSEPAEAAIATLATREDRTFVAQLDRVVVAGLKALGEPVPAELEPQPALAGAKRT